MPFRRLEFHLLGWCMSTMLCSLLFGYAWTREGLIVTAVLALSMVAVSVFRLFQLSVMGNRESLRLMDALQHGDMSQAYAGKITGAGLDELRQRCEALLRRTNEERTAREQQLRETNYMLEHVPMALLRIRHDGQVQLLNHASRNLCGGRMIATLEDLFPLGEEAVTRLASLPSGKTAKVELEVSGRKRAFAALTSVISSSEQQWTVVSLLDIQSELDKVQLQAWQELVSVLTHELMNSITPIASLAATTGELLEDVRQSPSDESQQDSLADMADALATIARRSSGLRDFVQGYRTLSRMPQPQPVELNLSALLEEVLTLFQGDGIHTKVSIRVEPDPLMLWADRDQLQHVLLNLLRNAAEACEQTDEPQISVVALRLHDEQIEIRVADNGPGVESAHVERLFMPFFTTKREGSGVGLALTRQVMLAHGGSVSVQNRGQGGAEFILRF